MIKRSAQDLLIALHKRARTTPAVRAEIGEPSGKHEFDQLCQALGIEHRLTKPKTPQTNGMVERFNGRISDILKTHHFHSGEDLRATLHRYVDLYNHQLPQAALRDTPASGHEGLVQIQPRAVPSKAL